MMGPARGEGNGTAGRRLGVQLRRDAEKRRRGRAALDAGEEGPVRARVLRGPGQDEPDQVEVWVRHPRGQDAEGPVSYTHLEPTRLRRISYAVFCLKKKNAFSMPTLRSWVI